MSFVFAMSYAIYLEGYTLLIIRIILPREHGFDSYLISAQYV